MVFFINVLRALAACLITNAHYTGIYPTDLIANGGLLGDVLFFAVSGYCLANVKYDLSWKGFLQWYGKRIWRIYPAVLIMTAIYMLLGYYSLKDHNVVWWYIYPTYYHFVASIIILYIPFFLIMKVEILRRNILLIMMFIMILWLGIYFILYDKSYYHIDTVREPMIRFLFMESLLLGAWFRQNDSSLRNHFKIWYIYISIFCFILYFISKLLFAQRSYLANCQFINQIIIFILLFFIFRMFVSIDNYLEKLPNIFCISINFISMLTLEIYVVQYVMISIFRNFGMKFPINWFALTSSIIVSAFLLHKLCNIAQVFVANKLK